MRAAQQHRHFRARESRTYLVAPLGAGLYPGVIPEGDPAAAGERPQYDLEAIEPDLILMGVADERLIANGGGSGPYHVGVLLVAVQL